MDTQWRVEIPLKYVYSPAWFSRLETRISVLTSPNVNMILFSKYTHLHTYMYNYLYFEYFCTCVHTYISYTLIDTQTLRLNNYSFALVLKLK